MTLTIKALLRAVFFMFQIYQFYSIFMDFILLYHQDVDILYNIR
jgi:hypothetical protein